MLGWWICLSLEGRESHSLSYMSILLSFSLDLFPLYPPCGANRAWWHALVFYCQLYIPINMNKLGFTLHYSISSSNKRDSLPDLYSQLYLKIVSS